MFVMKQACEFCKKVQAVTGNTEFFVSCNSTLREAKSGAIVKIAETALSETGLEPSCLWVELPERSMVRTRAEVWDLLSRLKKLGLRIAIDEFGEEHTMMSILKHSCIEAVKMNLPSLAFNVSDYERELSRVVIDLAQRENIIICSKFVEHKSQYELLRDTDFGTSETPSWIQGHYLSESKTDSEFLNMLGDI
jgi:EAL domain-containing protein (putative c-di-GMP-specific phosphodiesterase class I)